LQSYRIFTDEAFKHGVPTQIIEWKKQLLERASDVFGSSAGKPTNAVDLGPLHAKIGQQALEIDFLAGALTKAGLLSAGK
jgi:hypothetical protein